MKPLHLKDYTPPKGFMITREATYAERKQIGRETLVKVLAPEIWNMLYDLHLQGKSVSTLTHYHAWKRDWCIVRYKGDVKARCKESNEYCSLGTSYMSYPDFESELLKFLDPTYVQRLWKLCAKALRDEKARRGNARKEEAMKHLRETMAKREERKAAKPIKIKIDFEIEAWL